MLFFFSKGSIRQTIVGAEKSDTDFRNSFFGGENKTFSARTSFLKGISPVISSYDLLSDNALMMTNAFQYLPMKK